MSKTLEVISIRFDIGVAIAVDRKSAAPSDFTAKEGLGDTAAEGAFGFSALHAATSYRLTATSS